jgi:hypothetical protein
MPIEYSAELPPIRDLNLVKIREINADSVQFYMDGHTAKKPQKVTLTRKLAVAGKGSLGTNKIDANMHMNIKINEGFNDEKIVPLVVKRSFSVPVGASPADVMGAIRKSDMLFGKEFTTTHNLLLLGILPEGDALTNADKYVAPVVEEENLITIPQVIT